MTTARIHRLNLHTTYDIAWSPAMMARDLMQNFYDGVLAKDFRTTIQVRWDRTAQTLAMTGPAIFDPSYLWRIGLTTKRGKADQYAGGFGEGFAVAVLQILRDQLATVTTVVNNRRLTFSLDPVRVGDDTVEELICTDETLPPADAHPGTLLLLRQVTPTLARACLASREDFESPDHPWIGALLAQTQDGTLAIYRSKLRTGAIFYRRQCRARLDVPLVICCRRPLQGIRSVRDRLTMTSAEQQRIYKEISQVLGDAGTLRTVVMKTLRRYWTTGHPLLTGLAKGVEDCGVWPWKDWSFPTRYCTHWSPRHDKEALRSGYTLCAYAMRSFGMPTSKDVYLDSVRGDYLAPNRHETELFKLLRQGMEKTGTPVHPGITEQVFTPQTADAPLEGAFANGTITIRKSLFRGSFAAAFATYCHEVNHQAGEDGSLLFIDALTRQIERVILCRQQLDPLEEQWVAKVQRGTPSAPRKERLLTVPYIIDRQRLGVTAHALEDWCLHAPVNIFNLTLACSHVGWGLSIQHPTVFDPQLHARLAHMFCPSAPRRSVETIAQPFWDAAGQLWHSFAHTLAPQDDRIRWPRSMQLPCDPTTIQLEHPWGHLQSPAITIARQILALFVEHHTTRAEALLAILGIIPATIESVCSKFPVSSVPAPTTAIDNHAITHAIVKDPATFFAMLIHYDIYELPKVFLPTSYNV